MPPLLSTLAEELGGIFPTNSPELGIGPLGANASRLGGAANLGDGKKEDMLGAVVTDGERAGESKIVGKCSENMGFKLTATKTSMDKKTAENLVIIAMEI
ncbi:hypothetical protein ACSBR2_010804 [Camellia fascicularis]